MHFYAYFLVDLYEFAQLFCLCYLNADNLFAMMLLNSYVVGRRCLCRMNKNSVNDVRFVKDFILASFLSRFHSICCYRHENASLKQTIFFLLISMFLFFFGGWGMIFKNITISQFSSRRYILRSEALQRRAIVNTLVPLVQLIREFDPHWLLYTFGLVPHLY